MRPHLLFYIKVHIFWEGHKIMWNLPLTFDCMYCREDFAKFCGLLWICEFYSARNIVYISQFHKKTPQPILYLLSMCLKIGSFLMQDGSNFMESRRDLEVVVRSGLTILQTDTWVVCRFLYVPPQWVQIIFE